MKTICGAALLCFLAGAQGKQDIEQMGFMTGCWAFNGGVQNTEEYWTKPAGGTMMGISRTVAGGKTVFSEYAQIREQDGVLTYIVQLKLAAPTTSFKLTKLTPKEAVFSNPEHAYPTRIIYRRQDNDTLAARTEGTQNGKDAAEDYPYKRVKCE
jgi:hypothetical protein